MPDRAATCNELQLRESESDGQNFSATPDWQKKIEGMPLDFK